MSSSSKYTTWLESVIYDAYEGDKRGAWQEYYTYGGMPMVIQMDTHEHKSRYLQDLFERTYIKDVLERNTIKKMWRF